VYSSYMMNFQRKNSFLFILFLVSSLYHLLIISANLSNHMIYDMSDHMTGLVSYKSVISFSLNARKAVCNFQLLYTE